MNKVKLYVIEAYHELREKVSWPALGELQNSAVVVLIASFLIALIIWGMDKVSDQILGVYYNLI